jgi:SMI1 / KNR4 family (SUKH-1)
LDSDLAESISALRDVFTQRHVRAKFGKAEPEAVLQLKTQFKLPRRFREFLLAANPEQVETRTPAERVKLIPAQRLAEEQAGFALAESGTLRSGAAPNGWRSGWIIIGHSAILGDPYFLDVSSPDPEGDCPVYTAMSGTDTWKPRLCASSFAMFLRILAVSMEVAKGFPEEDIDMDDEQVFREALGPKIREYDPAALKAGHWT